MHSSASANFAEFPFRDCAKSPEGATNVASQGTEAALFGQAKDWGCSSWALQRGLVDRVATPRTLYPPHSQPVRANH
jgi:hypothetical protein